MAVFMPVPNGQVSVSELATWLAHSQSGQRGNCLWRMNASLSCEARAHTCERWPWRKGRNGDARGGKIDGDPRDVGRLKPFGP